MKLEPLFDNVLVKRLDADEVTDGGIIITDQAQHPRMEARVVAVGKGRPLESGKNKTMTVKVGEVVYFSKYAGIAVEVDDEDYIILDEQDILARVKE